MEIISIFEVKNSNLWAVCYPEDNSDGKRNDIFNKLFDQWNDTQFLVNYFKQHEGELKTLFWGGMSIDDAINQVRDEAECLEDELWKIVTKVSGYELINLDSIFKKLHNNIYSLSFDSESHRKGKIFRKKPMLRLYGIELDDKTLIITGGGIKLTEKMEGELEKEKGKLKRVQEFLSSASIVDRAGLIE